jgi:hypothetical protein
MIMTQKLSHKKSLEVAQSNFQNYMAQLDGSMKPFPEHLFDEVFHDDVTGMAEGHLITRIQLKEIHSGYFEKGSKATILHLKQVGKCSLDVKIRLQNDTGDYFIRKLFTIRDGKIATSMKYTVTLASFYPKDSAKKLTRPRHYYTGSTAVEFAVVSDRKINQRDQVKHFFIEQNAAARRAFKKMRIHHKTRSCSE